MDIGVIYNPTLIVDFFDDASYTVSVVKEKKGRTPYVEIISSAGAYTWASFAPL